MSQFLKHPLLIALISITYLLFGINYFNKSKSEVEIRGAYEEIKKISDELATSDEPGKIKQLIAAFSGEIVEGFRSGFSQNSKEDLARYLSIKNKVVFKNITKGTSSCKNKEKVIGVIKNDSDSYISNIKLNLSSYSKDNKMIDNDTKWLSDIKILSPGEEVPFSIERELGSHSEEKEDLEKNAAHKHELKIMSFNIKDIEDTKDET